MRHVYHFTAQTKKTVVQLAPLKQHLESHMFLGKWGNENGCL